MIKIELTESQRHLLFKVLSDHCEEVRSLYSDEDADKMLEEAELLLELLDG